jgi:hypothetical protein
MPLTPPPPHTPPPLHYPGTGKRVGHRLHPLVIAAFIAAVILIAAAITAAIVLIGTTSPPKPPPLLRSSHAATTVPAAVTLASADPITIGSNISITPAPGWTLAHRGPNWVTLADVNDGAQMYVIVKPADETDVVTLLQADINKWISTSGTDVTNLRLLGGPLTKTLQSNNFQRAASMDYTGDRTVVIATWHPVGVFMELLNTSNHLSAFIDYEETRETPTRTAGAGQLMINSML